MSPRHVALALSLVSLAPCLARAGEARPVEVGAGVLGWSGAIFLDKGKDDTFEIYPGFAGFSGGAGMALEARWRGWVGGEIDLLRTSDHGTGSINDVDFTVGQSALHVPLLLKVVAPVAVVRPSAFVGLEWVFPSGGEAETSPDVAGLATHAEAGTYRLLAFGFGFELLLPIEGADVRVPLQVRGARNGATPKQAADRYEVAQEGGATHVTFSSEWQWQIGATLGVVWYFL